jgi:hypothetical protein
MRSTMSYATAQAGRRTASPLASPARQAAAVYDWPAATARSATARCPTSARSLLARTRALRCWRAASLQSRRGCKAVRGSASLLGSGTLSSSSLLQFSGKYQLTLYCSRTRRLSS